MFLIENKKIEKNAEIRATEPRFFNVTPFNSAFEIELKTISLIGKVIKPIIRINSIKFFILFRELAISVLSLAKNKNGGFSKNLVNTAFTLLKNWLSFGKILPIL